MLYYLDIEIPDKYRTFRKDYDTNTVNSGIQMLNNMAVNMNGKTHCIK